MLAHSVVAAKSSQPTRNMLFLHGILGTGANWRGIARQFVQARPQWGAILVDLREHGDSLELAGPHTLQAAAADVGELERSLGLPVGGALGHSFGGKVVLEWLRSREGRPTEAWIVDSSPSKSTVDPQASATDIVIRTLEALPQHWESRDEFIDAVVQAGQPTSIAQWLAKNLRRSQDGGRIFGPRLGVIRDLVQDYAETDLWGVVESLPREHTLDMVIGGRSHAFSQSDRERAKRIAVRDPRVSVHVVEDAGHWVHIDAPEALLALLTSGTDTGR